ncbi:MAG: hypothetical protein HC799_19440 [Limnothrix sp. RL_2_0]|nr:hypothetical protein [Limnothrix sp. RL_2_0]
MANLNDFKLVQRISRRYADLLFAELGVEKQFEKDVHKERLGFYPFIIENVCGITDLSLIDEIITDTDFNRELHENAGDDCGIDVVHIDEDNNLILLFNFKYRETFKQTNDGGNDANY